ncbi:tetratricopeptide repeat protein [Thalassotalea ponticola]|uniref:tetratricopeptide repeat protein n=1 Tax=Thalassotalea ponticola TaxID=1523392 RepID=UPI0025B5E4E6|nr:tetratricopeptide repeat protein [Thalassotalea ponticola]MDN3651722.1 tetratricopeptide repeat protein [Thalassotalea ponticola]
MHKFQKILKTMLVIFIMTGLFACQSIEESPTSMQQYARQDLLGDEKTTTHLTAKTFESAFELAQKSENSDDLEQALYYYIQCLEFQPDNAEVLYRIARIHDRAGNRKIATRAYREALLNDNTMVMAHKALGIIEVANGNFERGKSHLLQAIFHDQKRLESLGATKEMGSFVPDLESPIEAYNVIGVLEDMERNFGLARTYYQLALKANPRTANILSNIGYSYYLSGELVLAERYFKKAININNTFERAWTNLGLVYARKGQYDRAIKTFKQVMPEHDAYNDLGYFVLLEGRVEEAEYFIKKAISLSPKYFEKANVNLEKVEMKKRELKLDKESVPEVTTGAISLQQSNSNDMSETDIVVSADTTMVNTGQ